MLFESSHIAQKWRVQFAPKKGRQFSARFMTNIRHQPTRMKRARCNNPKSLGLATLGAICYKFMGYFYEHLKAN